MESVNVFKVTEGVSDKRETYVPTLLAYLSSKLLKNNDVADFTLQANVQKLGIFGHVMIKIQNRIGTTKTFLINLNFRTAKSDSQNPNATIERQAGHIKTDSPMQKKLNAFIAVEYPKICKGSLKEITDQPNDTSYIYYILRDHFPYKDREVVPSTATALDSLSSFFNDSDVFKLRPKPDDVTPAFFDQLFILLNQKTEDDLYTAIVEHWQWETADVNQFILDLSNCKVLNRQNTARTAINCLLRNSHYSCNSTNISASSEIIARIFQPFDIIVLNQRRIIPKLEEYYKIVSMDPPFLEQFIDLINLDESKEDKYVVLSEKFDINTDIKRRKVLQNLDDLYGEDVELYREIVGNDQFICSMKGRRKRFYLSEIMANHDAELRKLIKVHHLLEMLNGGFHIGNRTKGLPQHYIERTVVREDNLDNATKLNIICGDARVGKSTFLQHLEDALPAQYFALDLTIWNYFSTEAISIDVILRSIRDRYDDFTNSYLALVAQDEKLVIFWDGLADLTAEDKENACKVFNKIAELGFTQWIEVLKSADLLTYLKDNLQASCYFLPRLNSMEQDELFDKCFADLNDIGRRKVEEFKHCSVFDGDFWDCPFHIHQLTSFLDLEDKALLVRYLQRVIDGIFEGESVDVTSENDTYREILEINKQERLRHYSIAAAKAVVRSTNFKEFDEKYQLFLEEEQDYLQIITDFGEVCKFSYDTFRYYFAAKWLHHSANLHKSHMVPQLDILIEALQHLN